jgi:hypothetical protein
MLNQCLTVDDAVEPNARTGIYGGAIHDYGPLADG